MRVTSAVVAAVGLAVVIGCGPERKLPSKDNGPADTGKSGGPSLPVASHPEAQKVVEQAVKAATEGDPKRLDRAKVTRCVAKGFILREGKGPGQLITPPTVNRFEGVWPDRLRWAYEFPGLDPKEVITGRRPGQFWWHNVTAAGKAEPVKFDDAREKEDIIRVDAIGQRWMVLLVPLTDPAAVVFNARELPVGTETADVIQVSLPNCPVFTLWFNKKTHLLSRLEYTHNEYNTDINKAVVPTAFVPTGGLFVPTKISFERNNLTVEQWDSVSWEFPEKIDDGTFDQPK